jgi:ribosomal protein S18 acetylase RimI-like enzyme
MPGKIRPLFESDRHSVSEILHRAGNFTSEEMETALELVDEWLADGENSDYLTYVYESAGEPGAVKGYVCFGEAPLTQGTYDLYWIAVDTTRQRSGIGKRLLHFAEQEIERRGGRLLLIETSAQETYGGTIRFYERSGYEIAARIKDYYKPGDDKLIFYRRISAGPTIEPAPTGPESSTPR